MSQHPSNVFRTSCGASAPLELIVSGPGCDGGERHVFEQPFVLVGRDELSCLRLEDEAVSRRHAYLQQLSGGIFCVDLDSRTGTRWEGESRPSGWLRPDRGIQIGPFTLELPSTISEGGAPNDESAEAGNPLQDRLNEQLHPPQFTIAVDHEVQAQFRMNRELVLVGTSTACRVRLRETGISRYHCSLVRTREGIWVVDLLSGTGIRLNGQPVRCARVNEGDLLRVGQYVLRLGYEGEDTTKRTTVLPEQRVETPVQSEENKPASGQMSDLASSLQMELDQLRERLRDADSLKQQLAEREAECSQFREQVRVLESQTAEATDLKGRLEAAVADAHRLKDVHLRDMESLKQQSADRETECTQLREQVRVLELQAAETADLEERLEAAQADAGKLEDVCAERDHLQNEMQTLRDKIASESAERDDLRKQLETAQQQLIEEREAVRAANERLDQQIAALQESQADAASRNAEHDERSQQIQQAREELVRSQDKVRDLQAELDEAKERQKDVEGLRQQLANAGGKHDQLLVRILELEDRAASTDRIQERLRDADAETERLREQLQAAESRLAELDEMRSEGVQLREQFRALEIRVAEADDLKTRLEAAQADAHKLQEVGLRDIESFKQQSVERETECNQLREQVRVLEIQAAEAADLKQRLETAQEEAGKHQDVHARDIESLRKQLSDRETECSRFCEQVRVLEIQLAEAADSKGLLEAARVEAGNLEDVRAERDRWQAETESLRAKIASELVEREQFDRLSSDLRAAQAERERLLTEQQASLHTAEQASARAAELEQAMTVVAASHEAAVTGERARWEAERRELKALIDQPRAANQEAVQVAIRDLQGRSAAERQEWTLRLEGAEAQIVWERSLFQEQSEQLRRQVAALQAERDRLSARLAQSQPIPATAQERPRDRASRPVETNPLRQVSIQDQALVQLFGMDGGQSMRAPGTNKPPEQGRPRQSQWSQGGDQFHQSSIEQGVEDAWTQAAARQRPAAVSNPPGHAVKQDADAPPDPNAKEAGENRAGQAIPPPARASEGESSPPSEAPQMESATDEGEQTGEAFHAEGSPTKEEERPGLWGKFLNMVRGK